MSVHPTCSTKTVLYQKYGEVLQLEGTHNITQLAMPFLCKIILVSASLSHFFLTEETEETIATGLKFFCDVRLFTV